MSPFQVLPAETKFYDWFEKAAQNIVSAAMLLRTMLDDGQDWPGRVAQMTELEHQGDFITHEIFDLLHHNIDIIAIDAQFLGCFYIEHLDNIGIAQ